LWNDKNERGPEKGVSLGKVAFLYLGDPKEGVKTKTHDGWASTARKRSMVKTCSHFCAEPGSSQQNKTRNTKTGMVKKTRLQKKGKATFWKTSLPDQPPSKKSA